MKLKLVTAGTGALWVRLGIETFLKQPLALVGLFFMFMALMSLASKVPLIGRPVAMMLLPAATLGLMAATREAAQGKFPMPLILLSGFRAGPVKLRSMLVLGGLYTIGFLCAVGASYLVDGGDFARMYLDGQAPTKEQITSSAFHGAMWTFIGLHLPLSLTFWHAPALVYWHDVTPLKSMFFSCVACLRNFWALTVFALAWMAVVLAVMLLIIVLSRVLNESLLDVMLALILPLVAAMFFTSLYFTYRDSFEAPPDTTAKRD